MGGATYLTCTLVADVLLSFGQLPRSYEVLDIMARTLDASVQSGIISDDAISQVQGCLRSIFRPARSSEQPEGTKIKLSLKPAAKATSTASASPDSPADDSGYERKLIQMVVKKALVSMKENDPQALADLQKELELVKNAANRWTDNVFNCKTYLVKKRGMDKKEAIKILGITPAFDCK